MGISKKEFDLLVALSEKKGTVSQRELSEKTGMSLGSVNRLLKEMNRLGLQQNNVLTEVGLKALNPTG